MDKAERFLKKFGEPKDLYGYEVYEIKKWEQCHGSSCSEQVSHYYIKSEVKTKKDFVLGYDGVLYFCPDKNVSRVRGVDARVQIYKSLYENSDIEVMQEVHPVFKNGKLEVEVDKNPTIFTSQGEYKLEGNHPYGTRSYYFPEYVEVVDERLIISGKVNAGYNDFTEFDVKEVKYGDILTSADNIHFLSGDKKFDLKNGINHSYVSIDEIYDQVVKREKVNSDLAHIGSNVSSVIIQKGYYDDAKEKLNKYENKNESTLVK
ncbi:MAG: hypothetical protein E7359_02995 [Clostridiales bacterium]|nr:hypothetical protein [Clostridiales bacterium]